MKTPLFLLLVALPFPLSFAAQSSVAVIAQSVNEPKAAAENVSTSKDSPALIGMRLGMSLEQTKEVAPDLGLSSKKRRNEPGVSISLSSKSNDEVSAVVNTYLNNKLVEIEVFFNPSTKWNSMDEIIKDLSKKLNLTPNAWVIDGNIARYASAANNFTIEVSRDLNRVALSDAAAKAQIKRLMDEKAKMP